MPLRKWLRAVAITLACVGMLLPTHCLIAEQPDGAVQPDAAVDVALSESGSFSGIILDGSGKPKAGLPIQIRQFDTKVVELQSDANGQFVCSLENGGVYLLTAGDQIVMLRCWAPGTAPPHARTRLMVQATDVVRGQIHPAACGLANPWVITGMAVAAIVIPVALHNNRSDRTAGSE